MRHLIVVGINDTKIVCGIFFVYSKLRNKTLYHPSVVFTRSHQQYSTLLRNKPQTSPGATFAKAHYRTYDVRTCESDILLAVFAFRSTNESSIGETQSYVLGTQHHLHYTFFCYIYGFINVICFTHCFYIIIVRN